MIAALLVALLPQQTSLVVRPMHLGEKPPEVRAARHILLRWRGSPGGGPGRAAQRKQEEALALGRELAARIRDGADFEQVALEHSDDPDARMGAVLGSFVRGGLAPELDSFLFSAQEGTTSDAIVSQGCVHILRRIDAHAGVLQIFVRGTGEESRARCESIAASVRAGADFASLARERSEDPDSAKRGGQFAIYERGPQDTLLKAAVFRLREGEASAPIQSSLGWHILKRVPVSEVDPALAEPTLVRLRAILVRFERSGRDRTEAAFVADRLYEQLLRGEDMRMLAREADEDPGGNEREGDLGWIHRNQADLPLVIRRACQLPVGEINGPEEQLPLVGWLILRREK